MIATRNPKLRTRNPKPDIWNVDDASYPDHWRRWFPRLTYLRSLDPGWPRVPVDDPRVRHPDIGLAKARLAWEPTVEITEGLVVTIVHFRKLLQSPD